MDNKEVIKMLNDEISKKIDADTLDKLKNARTKKEALSLLEGASVVLSDEVLSVVSGGDDDDGGFSWCPEKNCDGLLCPGYW